MRDAVFLLIVGLGPLLWMLKSSITPTQDTLRDADGAFPARARPRQLRDGVVAHPHRSLPAQHRLHRVRLVGHPDRRRDDRGYALSVLRPRSRRLILGLVIATLFVPPIVLLVPLYLTIVDMPIVHVRLIDSFWGVWLPAVRAPSTSC